MQFQHGGDAAALETTESTGWTGGIGMTGKTGWTGWTGWIEPGTAALALLGIGMLIKRRRA